MYKKSKCSKEKSNCIKDTIYIDEGISATDMKKCDGFKQMIADALAKKIDLIITK